MESLITLCRALLSVKGTNRVNILSKLVNICVKAFHKKIPDIISDAWSLSTSEDIP